MNEILLYGDIYSYSAREFITSLERANGDVTVRVNSNGGEVSYGWGMINKFSEFKGNKKVIVDGQAHSMAAMFLIYADDVQSVDTANFILHRAAYWSVDYEKSLPDSAMQLLNNINTSLRSAIEAKLDLEEFEKISGKTLDEFFSMNDRVDVVLNAKQARKIGLIDKIVQLTPKLKEKIEANYKIVASSFNPLIASDGGQKQGFNKPINNSKMTVEQLKAEHPALYAKIFGDGIAKGVANERDRVGAWATFIEVDAKRVADGIKSGEDLNKTVMAELQLQAVKNQSLEILNKEGKETPNADAGNANPTGTEEQDEGKAFADFQNEIFAKAGVKIQ